MRLQADALKRPCAAAAVIMLLAGMLAPDAAAQRAKRNRGGDAPAVVTMADVGVERMNERIAAVGSARSRQQVTLTTRVAGVIEEVLFQGGQLVEANQPLVRLNDEPERIAVETAEAQRAEAADTVSRYNQLREGTVTRVAIAQAETALKVADATLRRARDELERMTIRAPFKGMMGLSNLEVGDYLAVGSPIATIDDRTSLLIEFTVPEAVATAMKVGLPVRASLVSRSGELHQGTIQAVGTRIDPVTRTLVVRGEIPNPDLKLIPGSTFSISVQLPGTDAPVLPALAIQWDRQGAYVWRVNGENKVERVAATILNRTGDRVHVEAQLAAGDKIVVEGGSSLRESQVVRLEPSS